jgi:SAM-dependent methyltransferase
MAEELTPPQRPSAALNASFDGDPRSYDQLRASGHMARRRAEYFLGVVDSSPGLVVELGCGTGTLLRWLAAARPDRRFLGVEPLGNYVQFARERAGAAGLTNVRFETGTGERLRSVAGERSAGLLISVDALHHVTDLDQVIAEAHAVAAPGAHWRAMEPNRLHPYVLAYHVLTPGERTFPVRDFLRRSEGGGWRLAARERLYVFPSGISRVPDWAGRLERRTERFRLLSGAVVLDLAREEPVSAARGR